MKKLFTLVALLTCFMGAKAQDEPVYSIDYSDLTSFPFYVMGFEPTFDGTAMIDNGEGAGWHQYFIADQIPTEANGNYTVKAMVKASQEVSFGVQMRWSWSEDPASTSVTIGTEWAEVTWSYESIGGTSCGLIAQPGVCSATIEWKWLKVYSAGQAKIPVWTAIVDNDARCFRSKEYPVSDVLPSKIVEGEYVVNSPVQVSNPWDSQFWIRLPQTLAAGKKFKVSFDYKASAAVKVGTQAHNEPGQYIHWACIGDVEFTDGWQTFDKTITVPSECNGKDNEGGYKNDFRSITFNLSQEGAAIDYYFKNIKVEVDEDDVAAEFDYPDPIYTVAGTADLCGTAWNTRDNVMTYDEETGLFTWSADNITVNNDQKPEFKVVKDCDWETCWPDNNWVITPEVLGGEGTYSLLITFDPETKAIVVLDEAILDEVEGIADEDGVAVVKLLDALDKYTSGKSTKADLQAAIDQYKLDNADQEKDETAKVATNGWKKFEGNDAAGVCATQYAPAITTYDGRENVQMAEVWEGTCATTGQIIYQDITGLQNGKYKVGFYANAFSTAKRDGMACDLPEDGADDVAYVFANDQKAFVHAIYATATDENSFRTFDVDVTEGQIKLGMGKEKTGTNWHIIQIYQLTWFATAKEVYAQDQEELKALVEEAEKLVANETNINGKEEFEVVLTTAQNAIDSQWYNIPEIEEIIANLKTAMGNFKKANWFIDFAAGEYYIIHAQEGLKMAAGHDWGTRGIINEAGLDLTLTPYTESRTVTFNSRVYNNENDHFLGSNLYMDSSEWGWGLEYQGFGFYIVEPNSGKYINIDNNFNLVLSDTPAEWIIVSKDGVRAQLIDAMAEATKENPVDATGLIVAPNFNRNDSRNAEAWSVSQDCENKNLSGGNNINNCAESFHSTFTIMQTISDCPAGFYQLTAQGFYRQDEFEGDAPAAPVFFANEINGDVPARAEGGPNGMSTASEAFTNGDYTIAPITFEVKEDGMMYIGITASTNTQWVIWDNFQLKYFGAENPTTGITTVNATVDQNNNGIYNLNGQKVQNLKKGLYIINGKKVVK